MSTHSLQIQRFETRKVTHFGLNGCCCVAFFPLLSDRRVSPKCHKNGLREGGRRRHDLSISARQSVHVRRSRFISALIVVSEKEKWKTSVAQQDASWLQFHIKSQSGRWRKFRKLKCISLPSFFSAERGGPHPATVPRLPPRHGLLHVHRNERHPARRQQDHQTWHRL